MNLEKLEQKSGCSAVVVFVVIVGVICYFVDSALNQKPSTTDSTPTTDSFTSLSTPLVTDSTSTVRSPANQSSIYRDESTVIREETPDDAYDNGYETGYEQGLEDGLNGHGHSYGYDEASDYSQIYETKYREGYENGYDDGFDEGNSRYEKEEENDD